MAENYDNRRVAIACQGGGSHTAFTAGVLKKLLKEKVEGKHDYEVVALSGTSGGRHLRPAELVRLVDERH